MRTLRLALAACLLLAVASLSLAQDRAPIVRKGSVPPRSAPAVRTAEARTAAAAPAAPTLAYSVELPFAVSVQGSALFRTAVDFTNNTSANNVIARFQYSYICSASTCPTVNGFFRTNPSDSRAAITLQAFDTFHQDDFVAWMAGEGLLQPGAAAGSIGTVLVTFDGLPSAQGWEGVASARTYNRLVETDANQGTVGFAYNASLFFDSASEALVAVIRDTKASPGIAGAIRTNLGIRNTDVNGSNQNVSVQLSFYDTATGNLMPQTFTFSNLQPGETRQITDVWNSLTIPASVTSMIVFADVLNPTQTSPTIEGYINLVEDRNTKDASFFPMTCADTATLCGD
ncbi:MAG TPA: hypothetical protein VIE39_10885 [Thermoanaerobaculia bacterium]|jgi:hypothetical protein